MSLSARVSSNAARQILGRLFTSSLAFVITALLLPRQLSGADFGIFAFHLSLYQLLTNVIDFGAGTIVVREASREREQAGQLIGLLVTVKAVLASLGALLLMAVAWFSEGPGLPFVLLCVAALHMLFHAPGGAAAIFHVDMTFGWAVAAGVAGQSAWMVGTAVLLLLGVSTPVPYLLAFGAGAALNGLLTYAWARRRVAIRFDAGRQRLLELCREAWPAGLSMTLASVYFYVDAAMLRPLSGEVAVGRYRAAYSIMTFALMVPVLFSQVVFPVYSRLWAVGRRALAPFHRRSLRLLLAIGLPISVCVPQLRREIMAVVYPPEFGEASNCLGLLFAAVVLVFCAYPHVILLLAAGQQRTMMWISGAAALFNVLANLWAIPRHGIVGAAATTVCTEALVLGCAAVAGWRLTGIGPCLAPLLRPVLCAAGSALALWLALQQLPDQANGLRIVTGLALGGLGVMASGVLPVDLGGEEGAPEGGPNP